MLRGVGLHALGTAQAPAGTVAVWAQAVADGRGRHQQVGGGLARGGGVLGQVLAPAIVVLGGSVVPLGGHVVGPGQRVVGPRLLGPARGPELRVGALGIEAAALGAAEQVFSAVFSGDREWRV